MTKEELINKWEKEFAECTSKMDLYIYTDQSNFMWWSGKAKQIRECIDDIKLLK